MQFEAQSSGVRTSIFFNKNQPFGELIKICRAVNGSHLLQMVRALKKASCIEFKQTNSFDQHSSQSNHRTTNPSPAIPKTRSQTSHDDIKEGVIPHPCPRDRVVWGTAVPAGISLLYQGLNPRPCVNEPKKRGRLPATLLMTTHSRSQEHIECYVSLGTYL